MGDQISLSYKTTSYNSLLANEECGVVTTKNDYFSDRLINVLLKGDEKNRNQLVGDIGQKWEILKEIQLQSVNRKQEVVT